MFDVVVTNGTVIDGTGAGPVLADVAIAGDRVVAVGQIGSEAVRTIDATGLTVSPGFIDLHAHSDMSFLVDPMADSKLRQGVTLELVGNCGMSFCAPLNDSTIKSFKSWTDRADPDLKPDWNDFAGYLDALEQAGPVINVATQIGHNQVRSFVMGEGARAPSTDELMEMETIISEALDAGAMGLSTGLYGVGLAGGVVVDGEGVDLRGGCDRVQIGGRRRGPRSVREGDPPWAVADDDQRTDDRVAGHIDLRDATSGVRHIDARPIERNG